MLLLLVMRVSPRDLYLRFFFILETQFLEMLMNFVRMIHVLQRNDTRLTLFVVYIFIFYSIMNIIFLRTAFDIFILFTLHNLQIKLE